MPSKQLMALIAASLTLLLGSSNFAFAEGVAHNQPSEAKDTKVEDISAEFRKELDKRVAIEAARRPIRFTADFTDLVAKFIHPGMDFRQAASILSKAGLKLSTARDAKKGQIPAEIASLEYRKSPIWTISVAIALYRSQADGGATVERTEAILRNTTL